MIEKDDFFYLDYTGKIKESNEIFDTCEKHKKGLKKVANLFDSL